MMDRTPRGLQAREELIKALGAVECGPPDADGTFDVWLVNKLYDPYFYTTLLDGNAKSLDPRLENIEVTCTGTGS